MIVNGLGSPGRSLGSPGFPRFPGSVGSVVSTAAASSSIPSRSPSGLLGRPNSLALLPLLVALSLLVAPGCETVQYNRVQEAKFVKPTIAVMSFDNRAQVMTKWNLGDALADELIDRLIHTRRYVVLERAQLAEVFKELERVEDTRFRQTGSPQTGQLKHVKYLIRGVITDFGHVETRDGIARILDIFGTASHSVVRAVLYVVDVQSGQVVASKSVEAKVTDKKGKEKIELDGMAFGSYQFYHTSIGQATSKMLTKAVRAIARSIEEFPYQPKIASLIDNQVILNGGRNRKIEVGSVYVVRPRSQMVVDPDTGDVLGHVSGSVIGRVRVVQVTEKYSIADVVVGTGLEVGQTLFPYVPQVAARKATNSRY